MELELEGGHKEFFMKRFFNPHLKDIFFTFRNFGRICSQAMCEWKNADILLGNGVVTYKPLCYGEQKILGVERRSFFVTEKLRGQCFTDFLSRRWAGLDRIEREKIITGLAVFVRRIHDAGISLPDLYVWHIFITEKKTSGTGPKNSRMPKSVRALCSTLGA